jgi:hypothetical protein
MANTEEKAREWIDRLAAQPAIPFGSSLRKIFESARLTRLCDCGCNSFDIEVPDAAQIDRLAPPAPRRKGSRMVFEIVFESDQDMQIACLFFVDPRGHLCSIDITGGWSNHAPVPECVQLGKVIFTTPEAKHAL